jgi:hypothetical protein
LLDKALLFHLREATHAWSLGFGGRGEEEEEIWLLSLTVNRWDQNRALLHPQPRGLGLGSCPRTQTMGAMAAPQACLSLGRRLLLELAKPFF